DLPIMLQQFLEMRAGVQTGEPILAQPRDGQRRTPRRRALTLGYVVAETHVVADGRLSLPLGRLERLHQQLVPVLRAILAVVAQQDATALAGGQRPAQPRTRLLLAVPGLQATQVLPGELLQGIAAHAAEGAIGVDQRIVRRARLADDDSFRRRVEHGSQHLQRPLTHRTYANPAPPGCAPHSPPPRRREDAARFSNVVGRASVTPAGSPASGDRASGTAGRCRNAPRR